MSVSFQYYKIKFIESENDLLLIKQAWQDFEKTLTQIHISCSFSFLFIFWKNFITANDTQVIKKNLCVVILYFNNQIKAIFPLCIITRKRKKIFQVNSLEFIGQQFFSYYCDIITNDITKEEYDFILKAVYKSKFIDVINLDQISEVSTMYKLDKLNCYPYNLCYNFEIDKFENYENYQKLYSQSHKQNLRTAKNRLKNAGHSFEELSKPFEENDLPEITRLAKSKLLNNKICIYDDLDKKRLAIELYKEFNASIIFIKINNANVAYRINLFFRNKKFCLDASFDRDYRDYSVGVISTEYNIKDSFQNKNYEHSEGWGMDVYKEKFSTGYNILYKCIKKGNTPLSFIWRYFLMNASKKIADNFLLTIKNSLR